MKEIIKSSLILASLIFMITVSCQKKDTTKPPPDPPCNYIQWTGSSSGCPNGYYAVTSNACAPIGSPFFNSITAKCYATCSDAYNADPNGQIYRYNDGTGTTTGGSTTGGSTTGGSTTGGTTTGGSCASMSSYISFVSVVYNSCTNNSGATFTFKNNFSQKLQVKVPIKLTDGTWSCQYASPNAGATFNVWACNTTTTYGTIKSMLYSDWINNCTFGSSCP